MKQIHQLGEFSGTPGAGDYLAIDNGSTTNKIEMAAAVEAISARKNRIWYGTCSTSYSTTAKVVSCPGFVLKAGETIAVKFTNNNTATAPTLNVNSTGAVAIKNASGASASLAGIWQAGTVVLFTYDGTNWIIDNASIGNGVIVVSKSSVSSLSTTITDAQITSKHVVLNSILSNPAAQTGDWTVTTSNGSLSIAGSISGTTDITLVLGYQMN